MADNGSAQITDHSAEQQDQAGAGDRPSQQGSPASESVPPHQRSWLGDSFTRENMFLLIRAFYSKYHKGDAATSEAMVQKVSDEFEARVKEVDPGRGALAVVKELGHLNEQLQRVYRGHDLSEFFAEVGIRYIGGPGAPRTLRKAEVSCLEWCCVTIFWTILVALFFFVSAFYIATMWGHNASLGVQLVQTFPALEKPMVLASSIASAIAEGVFGSSQGGGQPHLQHVSRRGHGRWGRKPEPIEGTLTLSLAELYAGTSRDVGFHRQEMCETCHGTGIAHSHTCPACSGKGRRIAHTPFGRMQMECNHCGGSGLVVAEHCGACRGHGGHSHRRSVTVSIPPGARGGDTVTVTGEGHRLAQADDGDLVVRLKEQKDAQLTRSGADLRQTVWVSLHEALFGFTRSIAHPRGTPVLFDRGATGLTSHDEGVLIKGMGMPRGQGRRGFGDLLVRCRVKMPGRISASDKSLLREVGFRGIEQEGAEERGDKTAREEGEL